MQNVSPLNVNCAEDFIIFIYINFRLVAGDVRGNFKQLFSRVESINKKAGPFDMLFCVGDFYSKDNNDELIAYRNGYKNSE